MTSEAHLLASLVRTAELPSAIGAPLWRPAQPRAPAIGAAHAATVASSETVAGQPFCLHQGRSGRIGRAPHTSTKPCLAGLICTECGTVDIGQLAALDGAHRVVRLPRGGTVGVRNASRGGVVSLPPPSTDGDADANLTAQAKREWETHVTPVKEQPVEVMQHAWTLFRRVYGAAGGPSSVNGNRGKALNGRPSPARRTAVRGSSVFALLAPAVARHGSDERGVHRQCLGGTNGQ